MIHPNVKMDNLVPFLEKSLNSKVLDCSVSLLSTQGFGSTMLSVKVKVETNKRNGVSVEVRIHIVLRFSKFTIFIYFGILSSVFFFYLHSRKQSN